MLFARRAVERRLHTLEFADGIPQCFEIGHGRPLLIESRREAPLCYEHL
jgi:hypothetical protein